MPYIKLEDAKKAIEVDNVHKSIIEAMQSFLDNIPSADVEEVRHGRWIKDKMQVRGDWEIYDYCCSICRSPAFPGPYNNNDNLTPFCPTCGTKMDLKEEPEK